jgi:hypothetical protein
MISVKPCPREYGYFILSWTVNDEFLRAPWPHLYYILRIWASWRTFPNCDCDQIVMAPEWTVQYILVEMIKFYMYKLVQCMPIQIYLWYMVAE